MNKKLSQEVLWIIDPLKNSVVLVDNDLYSANKTSPYKKMINLSYRLDRRSTKTEVYSNTEGFELQFKDGSFHIKSKDDQWYVIENFGLSNCFDSSINKFEIIKNLSDMIESATIVNGEVSGKWCLCINKEFGLISFVEKSSAYYKDAFLEMLRQIACKTMKKTKKVVSGRKYETEAATYYYLGEFNYYSKSDPETYLKTFDKLAPVSKKHLFAKYVPEDIKTISEVLEKAEFYEKEPEEKIFCVYFCDSVKPMVDGGEALKDDLGKFEYHTEEILVHQGNIQNIGRLIHLFEYSTDNILISEKTKEVILNLLKAKIEDYLEGFYNVQDIKYLKTFRILESNDKQENLKALEGVIARLLNYDIFDVLYIKTILNDLFGIDFKQVLDEVYTMFIDNVYPVLKNPTSIKTIMENKRFFENRSIWPDEKIITIDDLSASGSADKNELLTGSLPNLHKELMTMVKELKGKFYTCYYSRYNINAGFRKAEKRFNVMYEIDLKGIYEFYKGEIPEKYETDLIANHISKFSVNFLDEDK